jgi:hypothetical protein
VVTPPEAARPSGATDRKEHEVKARAKTSVVVVVAALAMVAGAAVVAPTAAHAVAGCQVSYTVANQWQGLHVELPPK